MSLGPTFEPLRPAAFRGMIGVARREITPRVGIHATVWGASVHETATGTHRRIEATALAVRSTEADALQAILVAIDHIEPGDLLANVRAGVGRRLAREFGVDNARFMVACSHSHATPWLTSVRLDREGGDLLHDYASAIERALFEAAEEAVTSSELSTLTWAHGRCDLAANRDLPDPTSADGRCLVGFNAEAVADDTVVVGRVTRDADSRTMATIVNYACHPTVLGPLNTTVSPDFVGGMREVVETATSGAPCVFLQGASGELAPAYQYTADLELADRQGRRLGYVALSALEGMLEPGMELTMTHIVESGASLAVWEPRPSSVDTVAVFSSITSEFPVRDLRSVEELDATIRNTGPHWEVERLNRQRGMSDHLAGEQTRDVPAWVWRLGGSILVAHPNEAYSDLQTVLRARFPGVTVVVMNLVNDADVVAYLTPAELAGRDIYQVWQSPFGPGALERLIDDFSDEITQHLKE